MVQKWFPRIEQEETEQTEKLTAEVRKLDRERRQKGRIMGGRIMTESNHETRRVEQRREHD